MAIPASTNKVGDFIIFWECEFYSSFTDVNHMCDPSSPSKFPDRPFGSGEPAVWRVRIRSEPGGPGCHVWPGGPPILSCRRTALTICIFGENSCGESFGVLSIFGTALEAFHNMYMYMYMYIYICMYMYMYMYLYLCMNMNMYMYMYIYTCRCICICI